VNDVLAYVVFLAVPLASAVALFVFGRLSKLTMWKSGWLRLLSGNLLVLTLMFSLVMLAGETWFRFFYNTTDSLAYTKVCERWVRRHWQVTQPDAATALSIRPRAKSAGRVSLSLGIRSLRAWIRNIEDRLANRLRRTHPECEFHVLAMPAWTQAARWHC